MKFEINTVVMNWWKSFVCIMKTLNFLSRLYRDFIRMNFIFLYYITLIIITVYKVDQRVLMNEIEGEKIQRHKLNAPLFTKLQISYITITRCSIQVICNTNSLANSMGKIWIDFYIMAKMRFSVGWKSVRYLLRYSAVLRSLKPFSTQGPALSRVYLNSWENIWYCKIIEAIFKVAVRIENQKIEIFRDIVRAF